MIDLKDKQTGQGIGSITEQQLEFLVDQLEEESGADTDYYLNTETLDMFKQNGIDPDLLRLLQTALGNRTEMEIEWARK